MYNAISGALDHFNFINTFSKELGQIYSVLLPFNDFFLDIARASGISYPCIFYPKF